MALAVVGRPAEDMPPKDRPLVADEGGPAEAG